jgi:hypothetical protein
MVPFIMWGADVPGMKPVMEMHKKKHPNDTHIQPYIQSWVSMMVMWEALKRADKNKALNADGVKAALETLKDFDTGGLSAPITYTPTDHRPNTSLRIMKVNKDGKIKTVKAGPQSRLLGGWRQKQPADVPSRGLNPLLDPRDGIIPGMEPLLSLNNVEVIYNASSSSSGDVPGRGKIVALLGNSAGKSIRRSRASSKRRAKSPTGRSFLGSDRHIDPRIVRHGIFR